MTVQADGTKHIIIETSNGGVFPSADYLSKELRKQLRGLTYVCCLPQLYISEPIIVMLGYTAFSCKLSRI